MKTLIISLQRSFAQFLFFLLFNVSLNAQNIIAYYSGNGENLNEYPIQKLTHIIFTFCYLKGNKISVANRRDSATISRLVSLKLKNPNLKVILSLGGWGGCKTCSGIFSTEEGRESFANSVAQTSNYFHTDGIDIDWEFPSVAAFPGHPFSPDDKYHFTELLKTLRQKLGESKEISFIAAGFDPYLHQSLDWQNVMQYASRVNLMTYDLIGSKSKITGHHTPLYSTPQQLESTDHAVRYLDSLKVPPSKIAIGLAFYAREFDEVPDVDHGLYQTGKFKKFVSMKRVRNEYNKSNGYIEYWDEVAKAPYSYSESKKIFLTYDNEKSVAAKSAYVRQNHLNGIMFWQLVLDRPNDGLLASIYKVLRQ
jgi:chitinase